MIAILGASGHIGSKIKGELYLLNSRIRVRQGARKIPKDADSSWMQVDIEDEEGMCRFLENVTVLINAAGPAKKVGKKVAEISKWYKIPLIEIADIDPEEGRGGETPTYYACGAVPGVIGLLPRVIAETFEQVNKLTIDYIINEKMSLNAAIDMVENMKITSKEQKQEYIEPKGECVPFFGDNVYRYRFTDTESKLVDTILNVSEGSWNMVREDDDLEKILFYHQGNKEELAKKIFKVSQAKQEGRKSYIRFLIQMEGFSKGKSQGITAFCQASSASTISAKIVAATIVTYLEGKLSNTSTRIVALDQWQLIWENFMRTKPFETYEIYPYLVDYETTEEGEL